LGLGYLYFVSSRLDVAYDTSIEGLAGGSEADTYNWKDRTGSAGYDGVPSRPLLEFLRNARDVNAEPMMLFNTYGTGEGYGTYGFSGVTDTNTTALATLATNSTPNHKDSV